MLRKIRLYFTVGFLILASIGGISCSKKIYPSGLEGNLLGNQANFQREQRKRERTAKRENIRHKRLVRKTQRPQVRNERKIERERRRAIKAHVNRQDEHVQVRMKQNLREVKRNNRPKRNLVSRLLFWQNKKCK